MKDPQSGNIAAVIAVVREAERLAAHRPVSARVRVLRDCMIDNLGVYTQYHAGRSGFRASVSFGAFDRVVEDLMSGPDERNAGIRSVLMLAQYTQLLGRGLYGSAWVEGEVRERLKRSFDLAAESTDSPVLINTLVPPFQSVNRPGGDPIDRSVRAVNEFIHEYTRVHADRFHLVDWERLSRVLGEAQTMDYRFWYSASTPFSNSFLSLVGFEIVRFLRSLLGGTRKIVVVDADNTLWGGVVGEDGMNGIRLDPSLYPGCVYYEFQQRLLYLKQSGVLLAICSKNNPEDIWQMMDRHPHCVIRRDDLAAHRINWEDKASNLVSMSKELNLGLDSFVFIDDSAMDCDLVRRRLPDVAVLQVPERLYDLPELLLTDGLFDLATRTMEDHVRVERYHAEAKRRDDVAKFESYDDYLASLGLRADIHEATEAEIGRVAQLTQKTNQFNLTTRRYTESEITAMVADRKSTRVFVLCPEDRFGSYGLTGVLIVRRHEHAASIDTLLLSCRILGRRLEYALASTVLKRVEEVWGIETWMAEYVASPKNSQVADFFDQMGFRRLRDSSASREYTVQSGAWQPQVNWACVCIGG